MPGPWRPKLQLRSSVPGEHGPLSCAGARPGLPIDEVEARVSFTVETTVLPSFALRAYGRAHRPRMAQDSAALRLVEPTGRREAASRNPMVGMSGPWRPKFQLRSSVSARCNGGVAAQVGPRRPPARSLRLGERGVPTLANDRAAAGVMMGTGRRGGGAVQSWVKPTEATGVA
jgi:hypothetical protein